MFWLKKSDNLEYQIDIHFPAFSSKVSENISLSVPLRPNKKALPLAIHLLTVEANPSVAFVC